MKGTLQTTPRISFLAAGRSFSFQKLKGVKYSVFGVGYSSWVNTLHNVPKLVDGTTEQMGAEKLLGMRLADVAADVVGAYEEWCDELWEVLSADGHGTPVQTAGLSDLVITIQNGDRSNAAGKESMLVDTELVGTDTGFAKKHMEIALPPGMYTTGNYLSGPSDPNLILPLGEFTMIFGSPQGSGDFD